MIDGASRFVVSMNATDNKTAETVAAFFIRTAAERGVPHKVRADKGTENVHVERFAALLRELGYKIIYIAGKSVHNQRIERFWGDLAPYIRPIASVLQDLTDANVLDIDLVDHRTALHIIVIPYVNEVLDEAIEAWNNHRVSTGDMKCTPKVKCECWRDDASRHNP